MKKWLCALLAAVLLQGVAAAEVKVGFLTKLNITEEEYQAIVLAERGEVGWTLLSHGPDNAEKFVFYDSLMLMQMALNAGEIDQAALPRVVAEYVLNTVPDLAIAAVTRVKPVSLALGFRSEELRDRFNAALLRMRQDGTLLALRTKYLSEPGLSEPEPVKMERYSGADTGKPDFPFTVRVAVTGDLPPIDYVAADGEPAGFNTAVLAEVGRRLQVNIEVFDTEAGARTAALASRRADGVFWYRYTQDDARQVDVPEGIFLSQPYYEWDQFLYLRKK